MQILFVDNHPELTTTVTRSFLANDDVVVEPTIAEAKAKVAESSFDVILVDYELDDGKGDELVRWLLASRANSKIVGVSARDVGNEALLAAGAHAICPKLRFSQIQTVLRDVVAKST